MRIIGRVMREVPKMRVVTDRPAWLVTLCVALSFAVSASVSILIERRSQSDIDDVAESTRYGFDAVDARLRAVEQRCGQ